VKGNDFKYYVLRCDLVKKPTFMERYKKDLLWYITLKAASKELYYTVIILCTDFRWGYSIIITYLILSCLRKYIFFNLERTRTSTITVNTAKDA
jgi:hypothetical protein